MQKEAWQEILNNIKSNFNVEEHDSYRLDKDGGIDVEYIEFYGPLGLMKLEFISRPLVLDKKVHYSNRIGSDSRVEYRYDQTQKTSKLIAYKWDENDEDWIEIDIKNFEKAF